MCCCRMLPLKTTYYMLQLSHGMELKCCNISKTSILEAFFEEESSACGLLQSLINSFSMMIGWKTERSHRNLGKQEGFSVTLYYEQCLKLNTCMTFIQVVG